MRLTRRSFVKCLGWLGVVAAVPVAAATAINGSTRYGWLSGWSYGPAERTIANHYFPVQLSGPRGIVCKRCGFTAPRLFGENLSRKLPDGTTAWSPEMTPYAAGLDCCPSFRLWSKSGVNCGERLQSA